MGNSGGVMRPGSDNSAAVQAGDIPSFDLNEAIKRVLDVVAAIIGIILFAPILVTISLAVKLGSRGPIFVRETKYGYDNRAIKVLKFRVMAARINLRVTQVGQILSQTGIDELPQLFDVLRGEMSILGRRNVLRWPASHS
jgi:polysaccharide biosynthesis protein PslA